MKIATAIAVVVLFAASIFVVFALPVFVPLVGGKRVCSLFDGIGGLIVQVQPQSFTLLDFDEFRRTLEFQFAVKDGEIRVSSGQVDTKTRGFQHAEALSAAYQANVVLAFYIAETEVHGARIDANEIDFAT